MLFRPSESSQKIADFYKRYLLTTFKTNVPEYNSQLKEALETPGAIADGPYISMTDPYEKGKTLEELAEEGIVSSAILKYNEFHPTRPLYRHQEDAIRKANDNKNLIVTTGTGSGKTESFLIPVINQLLREKENGTLGPGVRTLIIYPMNALVNDQIRRLREILSNIEDEPKITFGKFTGETEKAFDRAKKKYEEIEDTEKYPLQDNELISREQMRETPPNILITNYAMLEYMLLRPGDNVIFSDTNADKWQYIVFDEAHSYNGAKGIEVSALVRRVKAMLNRDDIKFILTSATLGDEKANDNIIRFGETLCSARFDKTSIIRSHTSEPKPERVIEKIPFQFYTEFAELVRDNVDDNQMKEAITAHNLYYSDDESIAENLYDIVLHDSLYYEVRKALYGKIKTVKNIARELNMTENQFTDYIAVASNAIKNGDRLFEAKYHMFFRGIEGVYVTLAPSNKLFTHKMDVYKETPNDDGFKAYEISFCDNCHALYITGEINEEGKLVQKARYNDEYRPEVFLLSGEFDDDDGEYDDNTYQICSKCGAIKHASSLNGLQCGHGAQFINKLIKVKEKGEQLHKCACCNSINTRRSIVRPYYLGNEAATAVLSTALYNELPSEIHKREIKETFDPLFGETFKTETEIIEKLSKQFLAFSDNRQSAAFFASYLDTTYKSTLIKRIMYCIMEERENDFQEGIGLKTYVDLINKKLVEYEVYPELDNEAITKEAWKIVLKEIANYKAKNSLLRTAGLVFEADVSVDRTLNGIDLSVEEINILFKALIRTMMRDSSVLPGVNMTDADEKEISASGSMTRYVAVQNTKKYLKGWSPEDGKTNPRLKYAAKVIGDEQIARSLLHSIWEYMRREGILATVTLYGNQAFMLNPEKIKVRKVNMLFECPECRRVSPYNLKGICASPNCGGTLREFNYAEELKDHHYRTLYKTLDMVPMEVREHTAQLSSEQAYRYQKQFKDKMLNVLSCSTTFEMGVDVGSLETVFMRNMPPSPANYAQRAGRAGRSLQSAAYAVTYCPNSSHDLNYFRNPIAMIKGTIVPPNFNVANDKIVLRHIFASAFSFFWRKYPVLYNNSEEIGVFIENDGFDKFRAYLNEKPEELKEYLNKVVPEELKNYFTINSFGWVNLLFNEDEETKGFGNMALERYNDDLRELQNAEETISAALRNTNDSKEKKRYRFELNRIDDAQSTIKDQKIIEFLSKNNLIPKYGFPVDTVELKSAGKMSSTGNLSLSRDLMTAISEYAPESEVIADGKRLKSRYIKKLTGHGWPKYKYVRCKNCETLNRVLFVEEITECKCCGEPLKGRQHNYIIPKFGFIMDNEEPKPVGTNKPERTYRGVISYIGDENEIDFYEYNVGGTRVVLGNSKMDKLAVLNEAPFYVCESCGYTILRNSPGANHIEYRHNNPRGYSCNGRLTNYALGHEFTTDVALIKFVDFDIRDVAEAWTILYSLLEGLSKSLNIDRNEISGCIQWYKDSEHPNGNFGFVLFDNTPGGAGYVRQLADDQVLPLLLKEGYRVVSSCSCGGENADTACYSCLCNYYNQKQHDLLKRKYAISFYKKFGLDYSDEWTAEIIGEVKKIIDKEQTANDDTDNIDSKKTTRYPMAQVELLNDGTNQSGEDNDFIWDNVIDDCEEDEVAVIESLKMNCPEHIEKPWYRKSLKLIEDDELIQPVLLWEKSKVMLFINDCNDDYETAVRTGWHCFTTRETINEHALFKLIEV